MKLTTRKGKEVFVQPGESDFKWNAFRFECKDLQFFALGKGSYRINRNFSGTDSIVVTAVSEELELTSSFKIPVKYCQEIRLDNTTIEFGSSETQEWKMAMNDSSVYPLDDLWVDTTTLMNESDPIISFQNGVITLKNILPVEIAHIRFVDPTSQKVIVDKELAVTYPSYYNFDFSGFAGRNGRNGTDGSISAQSGSNGENGEKGSDASPVTVFIRKRTISDTLELLEVSAVSGNKRKRMYLSSSAPRIIVSAKGGNGGNGGKGGAGTSAAQTDKQTDLQAGGNGGTGGLGGHGGDGGDVLIVAVNDLPNAEAWITVKNEGGTNGSGGSSGESGRGDKGDNGLLFALFYKNDGAEGSSGESGYQGRDGNFLGAQVVTEEEFKSLLEKAGWF